MPRLKRRALFHIKSHQLPNLELLRFLIGHQRHSDRAAGLHGDGVGGRIEAADSALHAARSAIHRLDKPAACRRDIHPPGLGGDATRHRFVQRQGGDGSVISHEVELIVGVMNGEYDLAITSLGKVGVGDRGLGSADVGHGGSRGCRPTVGHGAIR